jgi:hypothetical protein
MGLADDLPPSQFENIARQRKGCETGKNVGGRQRTRSRRQAQH